MERTRCTDTKMITAKEEGVLSHSDSLETIHHPQGTSHCRAAWKRDELAERGWELRVCLFLLCTLEGVGEAWKTYSFARF